MDEKKSSSTKTRRLARGANMEVWTVAMAASRLLGKEPYAIPLNLIYLFWPMCFLPSESLLAAVRCLLRRYSLSSRMRASRCP